MDRRVVALSLIAALAGAAGCGTTQITTSDPSARVVADGRVLGRGKGQLTRRGFPGSTSVVVRTEDGRQGEMVIRRRFTGLTLLMGLFTYGVCLVACWEYPGHVMVPLPAATTGYATPGGADPWLEPPPGWQPSADKAQ
jgi:hypothetical protein